MEKNVSYIFVLVPKKRKRPDPKYYGSILYHYRYWIYYYFMLPDQDPLYVIRNRDPIISFPVMNDGEIRQFAYELGGEKVGEMRRFLKMVNSDVVIDVIGFELSEKYHRHLAFALVAAVERRKTKLDLHRAELLTANQGFIMLMANLAEEVYSETKDAKRVLQIGRALKIILEAFEKKG